MISRLIIFSPIPPSRNGIADYTAALVSALGDRYDCLCVVPDDAPIGGPTTAGIKWITVSRYAAERHLYLGERHLFQIGNNTGHAYVLPWLERLGGVTTIHDASLANLFATIAPGGYSSLAFLDAVACDADTRALIRDLEEMGSSGLVLGEVANGLHMPARASYAVVVHSRVAASRVLSASPGARVEIIPHLAAREPPPSPTPVADGRPIRLLCLGFVARAKRIDLVLRAAKLLRDSGVPVEVTVAGAPDPISYDLEADIADLKVGDFVQRVGYLEEVEIGPAILKCDLLINLRDPTSGETSGVVTRAMALGRAAVVTDVGSYAELPDDAVVKVPLAAMTPEGLAGRLLRPIHDPGFRHAVGRRAWESMEEAAPARIAERYATLIEAAHAAAKQPGRIAGRAGGLRFAAPGSSATERPLWRLVALLPFGAPEWTLRILGGNSTDHASARSLGWSIVEDCAETPADAILALEPLSGDTLVALDAWLGAALACLAPGGPLVVAGRWSAHSRDALRDRLASRGFMMVRDYSVADLPARLGASIVVEGWRGMLFAPTDRGLTWQVG